MNIPYAKEVHPYVWDDDCFTSKELDILQGYAKNAEFPAVLDTAGFTDRDVRRSSVTWINNNNKNEWIFSRLSQVVGILNARFYGFNLTGFGEALQLTNYDSTDKGMYRWHQDYAAQVSRKLSVVIQLSDPSEYDGGELQIMTGPLDTVKKQRGLATVFPSWAVHQVTPVTRGTRQTLVAWISGPDFI